MSLVIHARNELELLGEEPETIDQICEVIQKFSDMGHSGYSALHCIAYLEKLLRFEELTPITDDPSTWMVVGDGMSQSRRNPCYFSSDGGKTYTSVNDSNEIIYTSKDHNA